MMGIKRTIVYLALLGATGAGAYVTQADDPVEPAPAPQQAEESPQPAPPPPEAPSPSEPPDIVQVNQQVQQHETRLNDHEVRITQLEQSPALDPPPVVEPAPEPSPPQTIYIGSPPGPDECNNGRHDLGEC